MRYLRITKVILAKDGIIENYDYLNEYDRLIQFITSNDMSLESNYEQLQLQMDVQSYLDYLCANMYIAKLIMALKSRMHGRHL